MSEPLSAAFSILSVRAEITGIGLGLEIKMSLRRFAAGKRWAGQFQFVENVISVEQMATDMRRHLDHLPVSATSDTLRYRMTRFIARNRTRVIAAAFIVAAVLAGAGVSLYEGHRAHQNELRAERRFSDVRALENSLLFEIHDAIRDLPGSTPARKLIVERALKYLDSLTSEAGGDPSLERELATAYERVGEVQGQYLSSSLAASLDLRPKALAQLLIARVSSPV